ncbi:MAG TPA: nickel pincer cofactor biosynthesis protein LarB [Chloroflexia bacterium]|nr:nickel pincer cofactor biosynthesis protein LarB [Chloroflexia bacterium]
MNLFEDLSESLLLGEDSLDSLASDGRAHLDLKREERKGIPEIIYAERKLIEDSLAIARKFLNLRGRAIISRAQPELRERVLSELSTIEYEGSPVTVNIEDYTSSKMIVLRREGVSRPQTGGRVGIISAGTSDVPVAEEAAVVAMEMGCSVSTIFDVGVAGLHRLFKPLERLLDEDVDVIIVAAGMDGALPSVVTGLVSVPVIGLPTSVGYGMGGKGVAALMTMLQSCAPGLTVVNIDNGVGAGATAALTANRMARIRARQQAI